MENPLDRLHINDALAMQKRAEKREKMKSLLQKPKLLSHHIIFLQNIIKNQYFLLYNSAKLFYKARNNKITR